jgi:antitoxin MazE
MQKTLSSIGNSLGLIIERPILELLNIDKETPLEIKTDGKALIITPIRHDRRERLAAITEKLMNRHEKVLKELAK